MVEQEKREKKNFVTKIREMSTAEKLVLGLQVALSIAAAGLVTLTAMKIVSHDFKSAVTFGIGTGLLLLYIPELGSHRKSIGVLKSFEVKERGQQKTKKY